MAHVRLCAVAVLLVLLGTAAAPAEATLRVSSGAGGLVVTDLNDLSDDVSVTAATLGGQPVFLVQNKNLLDIFKFQHRPGCSVGATDDKSVCVRGNGKVTMNMAGRGLSGDKVDLGASGASSSAVVFEAGFITFVGSANADTVTTDQGLSNDIATRAGDDVINLGSAGDTVDAGSGDDQILHTVDPNSLEDSVQGGPGNDTINLSAAGPETGRGDPPNRIRGGSGSDSIITSSGPDRVDPGSGADEVSTRAGEDVIESKEGADVSAARDEVTCGSSNDEVVADLRDVVDTGTCERRDVSPVGETPHVKLPAEALGVSPAGRVAVRLRCPRGVGSLGCAGALQLRLGGGAWASRSRKVRYAIRAGRRQTVRLRLTATDVRHLRRHPSTHGTLTSVEEGRLGLKTTIRSPRLRLNRG
jgi:RTX calcium-binding nonapeptide repeat (4 copies)